MSKTFIAVIKIHKTKLNTKKDILFYFCITFTSNGEA